MLIVAKSDESDNLKVPTSKSPNGRSSKSKRSNGRRESNDPISKYNKKRDQFGSIPTIPRKVVEVIQFDVIESYGPVDEINYGTAKKDGSSPVRSSRVVAT